jgi:formamidopyrimidine-DNA glycosylase
MPELPEVETIAIGLKNKIVGHKIVAVKVIDSKIWQADESKIMNRKIINIRRRAKTLAIDFENNYSLLFHLKMTGQLIYRSHKTEINQQVAGGHPSNELFMKLPNFHTRVIFSFANQEKLYFNDLRRFGWVRGFESPDLDILWETEYGPEPFSNQFTVEYLYRIIAKKPKSNIKKIITDQKLIAGIGNIYSDESLFLAGISPIRFGKEIKKIEVEKLHWAIIQVLSLGLKYGGASDSDYVDALGRRGRMQEHFKVYMQQGKNCQNCHQKISKIRLNGRGTHFCQNCQQ